MENKVESMAYSDFDNGEGFAVKVNGELVFDYWNDFFAPEDSNLRRAHGDVVSLPKLLKKMYEMGSESDGADLVVKHYETEDRDEYIAWAK